MSSFRRHVPEVSLEIVTCGAVQVVEEGAADGVGVGVLEGAPEPEVLASAEAPAGSTLSCPLWAGPQALSERAAVRVSPRVRRRVLQGPRPAWRWCCSWVGIWHPKEVG